MQYLNLNFYPSSGAGSCGLVDRASVFGQEVPGSNPGVSTVFSLLFFLSFNIYSSFLSYRNIRNVMNKYEFIN